MGKFKEMKKQIMANDKCPKIRNYDNAIHISIKDNSEIISPYSEDNLVVINSEFASFLENSVKDVPIKQDLTLEITTQKGDLNTISNAIKNYYYNEFMETERKLKRNSLLSLITFIIGVIALSATILLTTLASHLVFTRTLDIFAWVFVWQAVDLYFFQRTELKHQQCRQMNFINAKINLIKV